MVLRDSVEEGVGKKTAIESVGQADDGGIETETSVWWVCNNFTASATVIVLTGSKAPTCGRK